MQALLVAAPGRYGLVERPEPVVKVLLHPGREDRLEREEVSFASQ